MAFISIEGVSKAYNQTSSDSAVQVLSSVQSTTPPMAISIPSTVRDCCQPKHEPTCRLY